MIRKSTHKDIPALLLLFDEARATIAALGINQWQNGYPSREVVTLDIERGESYVYIEDGKIVATFAMLRDTEPTYDRIYDGEWLSGDTDRYVAVHRFAISLSERGRGLATKILTFVEEYAIREGKPSIRIDTHEGNVVMRKMLSKNGFSHCGTITLEYGDARVAYEKRLRA